MGLLNFIVPFKMTIRKFIHSFEGSIPQIYEMSMNGREVMLETNVSSLCQCCEAEMFQNTDPTCSSKHPCQMTDSGVSSDVSAFQVSKGDTLQVNKKHHLNTHLQAKNV